MRKLSDILAENKKQRKFVKQNMKADLAFDGYYIKVPDVDEEGVYVAFARRKKNPQAPENYSPVYIGIGNIKTRISDHINNDHSKWAREGCYAPGDEEVVYSYALCQLM